MTALIILAVVLTLLLALFIYYARNLQEQLTSTVAAWNASKDEVLRLGAANAALRARAYQSESVARQIVVGVAPLIEQTDWMTGRWAGRFAELQRLEAERNQAAREVRRKLWAVPEVKDYIRDHPDIVTNINLKGLPL